VVLLYKLFPLLVVFFIFKSRETVPFFPKLKEMLLKPVLKIFKEMGIDLRLLPWCLIEPEIKKQ
jgi:hypothetical protein